MAGAAYSNGVIPTFNFEKLTVGSSSTVLTVTKYFKQNTTGHDQCAKFALVTVETNPIRYRTDGTAPDSTTGHLLNVGDIVMLDNYDDIRNFKAIRTGSDGVIQVSYS